MPRRKPADTVAQRPDEGASEAPAPTAPAAPEPATTRAPPRDGTKIATVLDLLRQPGGTTIADISAATGWQSHTVRGALAGAIGRRMGLKVISHKENGEARRYRLAD